MREVKEKGDICIPIADLLHCKQKLTQHCKAIVCQQQINKGLLLPLSHHTNTHSDGNSLRAGTASDLFSAAFSTRHRGGSQ